MFQYSIACLYGTKQTAHYASNSAQWQASSRQFRTQNNSCHDIRSYLLLKSIFRQPFIELFVFDDVSPQLNAQTRTAINHSSGNQARTVISCALTCVHFLFEQIRCNQSNFTKSTRYDSSTRLFLHYPAFCHLKTHHIRDQTSMNSSKPVFPFGLHQPNIALLARISLARPLSLRAHMTSRAARSAELAHLTADHTHPLYQHALLVCWVSSH